MLRWKLAVRNVLRNRKRSLVTILMIASGFAAIVTFNGYANWLLNDLKSIVVETQYGHLQMATQKFWERANVDASEKFFSGHEHWIEKIRAREDVLSAVGRIESSGLASNGDDTVGAMIQGLDPVGDAQAIRFFRILEGTAFDGDSPYQAIIGEGLRRNLGLSIGSTITLVAHTVDGSINAIDVVFKGVFGTTVSDIDHHVIVIPLAAAQTLLDTDQVQKIVIKVRDEEKIGTVASGIEAMINGTADSRSLSDDQPKLTLKSWRDLAEFYNQVEAYFLVQNRVIATIIVSLVVLSVMNIVAINIFERTIEIGTVRAMGDSGRDLVMQFLLESATFVGAAGILGSALSVLIAKVLTALKISVVSPGASQPILMRIDLDFLSFVFAFLLCVAAVIGATVFPLRQVLKMKVVEALRKNA